MTTREPEVHDATPATEAVGSLVERGVRRVVNEGTKGCAHVQLQN